MRLFARSSALIAAVLVIAYGLWRTRSQAETLWLTVVAVATLLLAVVFWPRVARGEPLMERTVVRVAVVFLVGFLALSVQLVRIQIVDSAEILGRSEAGPNGQVVLNPRESIEASRLIRGRILASDGSVIADTVRRPDGSYDRVYPDPATAYLAGYYSPLMYGSSGLEESYNAYLRGEQGGNPVTEWLDGILHRERHGYDLTLSIDPDLQRKADELLGNRQGAVILMDAKTGAVLAMVSKPNFDPNQLYANVGPNSDEQTRRAQAYWRELQQSGNSPLVVRATQGRYVPGSIFKTVTASAAIETGTARPDTVYRDEGALNVDSRVIIEQNRPDPKRVNYTLSEAYGYSLNVVFAQVGLQLGGDRLADYAKRFGFGQEIPFDVPVAASQIASDPAFLTNRAGLADTAFGQGQLLVTPMQMALVAEAVANNGVMMRPYLVEKVSRYDGKTLQTRGPEAWLRPIKPETAAQVRDMMVKSVQSGYARDAQIPGYTVGGKTGTAEVGQQQPHAWFIGFAGKGEPQYVVAVIVEHGGSGGKVALPIGRDLLRAALERK